MCRLLHLQWAVVQAPWPPCQEEMTWCTWNIGPANPNTLSSNYVDTEHEIIINDSQYSRTAPHHHATMCLIKDARYDRCYSCTIFSWSVYSCEICKPVTIPQEEARIITNAIHVVRNGWRGTREVERTLAVGAAGKSQYTPTALNHGVWVLHNCRNATYVLIY